jgi:RNA methyltransferase, TrmH family
MGAAQSITETITSRVNPKVKFLKSLSAKKNSRSSGFFVVEGIHHVGEALEVAQAEKNIVIHSLYYAPELITSDFAQRIIRMAEVHNIATYRLSEYVFVSVAEKENPQGILAVVERRVTPLSELTPQNFFWGVALVLPQDAGNIGTIMRTIDAVNADGLILLEGGADPFHSNAVRASMGTLFWRPVVEATFDEFRQWSQHHGYHVFGTSAHASQDYREGVPYPRPAILLMGSEQKGLSNDQALVCEKMVSMPMKGRASSLNLAVATGVMLYAMLEEKKL